VTSVLLIDDSPEVFEIVKTSIGSLYSLKWAENLQQAQSAISQSKYDLILLDLDLPDGNGMDFFLQVQPQLMNLGTPLFFLTANSEISNKVLGFSMGADDYIVKPFSPLELKARAEARLKKQEILKNQINVMAWKDIKIDKDSQDVFINQAENFEKIKLTAIEFKILMLLAHKPNVVINREEILNAVWGRDVFVDSRSVDTHVSKLRKKLSNVSHLIQSVHGSGYKFVPA
jgi:DNA-binding response OmpR family regulator